MKSFMIIGWLARICCLICQTFYEVCSEEVLVCHVKTITIYVSTMIKNKTQMHQPSWFVASVTKMQFLMSFTETLIATKCLVVYWNTYRIDFHAYHYHHRYHVNSCVLAGIIFLYTKYTYNNPFYWHQPPQVSLFFYFLTVDIITRNSLTQGHI